MTSKAKRPNVTANPALNNSTSFPSSSTTTTPASSPPSSSPSQRCYCSDPSQLLSDLICSQNTAQCYATHTSCLKDDAGRPFTSFVLGRSCFLCAHCVGRRGFRHPPGMDCTLDSKYGCFYEAKGWREREKERENKARPQPKARDIVDVDIDDDSAPAAAAGKEDERDKEDDDDAADESRDEDDDAAEAQLSNGHTAITKRTTRSAEKDINAAAPSEPTASASSGALAIHQSSSLSSLDAAPSGAGDEDVEPKKGKRRGIRDSDKKARMKLVPRCTSPSHFLIDEPFAAAFSSSVGAPSSAGMSASSPPPPLSSSSLSSRHADSADKLRTDSLLASISQLYYRHRALHPTSPQDVLVSAEYDRTEYNTLDTLCSPLRHPSPLDSWSPLDVAMFDAGICCHGKDFHAVSRMMAGRKSVSDCVEFYYLWKKSGHYAMWKEAGKPVRRRTDGKVEQWRLVDERMQGWRTGAAAAAAALAGQDVAAQDDKKEGAAPGKRKREDDGAAETNGVVDDDKRPRAKDEDGDAVKADEANGGTQPTAPVKSEDVVMSVS